MEETQIKKNTCDGCTMCCKLLAVPELKKPAGMWCELVQINKQGCNAYQMRPAPCREFECLYIQMGMPEEYKPTNLRAVLALTTTEPQRLVVHIDPNTPDAYLKHPPLVRFLASMSKHDGFIVVCGEERRLIQHTRPPRVQ